MAESIRVFVRGAYDIQKLRIMSGNRIVAQFKARMGQSPGESEDVLPDEATKILANLREAYQRIADAGGTLTKIAKTGTGDAIIADLTEFALVQQYSRLLETEESHFAALKKIVEQQPIWTEFLLGVKGCGPAMAGVLISEVDIAKARYPSSLWKYAGLDVGPDGAGRSRRAEHLVEVEYTNRDGELATRKSITFNPFLKTKLMGVLAPSFLKCNSPYREHYDNMKHRLTSAQPADAKDGLRKIVIHNRAARYMIKMFLIDYYKADRGLAGLPIAPSYHEAKLGHIHRAA